MRKTKNKKNIVVIGGGTGVFTVLTGLRNYPVELSAIISMADDGGSTGILREEFGILPPGDIRRALVALSYSDNKILSDLFNYRFKEGAFRGHAFGNIMLIALERLTGSFRNAISEAGKILRIHGRVIPVTLDNVRLCAVLENGETVKGESNIDIPKHDSSLRITRIYLEPRATINEEAKRAVQKADLVVIGPGDLFTSILPNIVVDGMPEALKRSRAKKAFVVNTMTKAGETNGFAASDYLREMERYLGKDVLDYIVVNTKKPPAERLVKYLEEGKTMVEAGALSKKPKPVFGKYIRRAGYVRHDPDALASALIALL
jgi:uncharacterized cofD-like protein